ncbi:three component ABC system middle component [Thalassotalea piscium]
MANAIHQLGGLNHNPYLLAPLLQEFYQHLEAQPKNILFCYLVLPLIFNPNSLQNLQRLGRGSTLNTKFSAPSSLEGLEQRLLDFKELTNLSMLVLKEQGTIINTDLSVKFFKFTNDFISLQKRASQSVKKFS